MGIRSRATKVNFKINSNLIYRKKNFNYIIMLLINFVTENRLFQMLSSFLYMVRVKKIT